MFLNLKEYKVKPLFFLSFMAFLFCCTDHDSILKTGYIDVGKTKLYYEEKGTGHPVIMIHGGFLTHRMWDDQFEEFAKYFRTIRYDARGHGKSKSVPDSFTHCQDLNCLIEQLNIDKAAVMGFSMGGYIAIDFALKYPDKVSALVLVAPGLSGYEFHGKEFEEYAQNYSEAAQANDVNMIIEAFLKGWTDGPYRNPSDVNLAIREKVRNMAEETAKNRSEGSVEFRLTPLAINRLSEIKAPTLAVVGDLDMPGILEIGIRL